jgi:hypothetical protein
MDYAGRFGIHFTPSVKTTHRADSQMGCCWEGIPISGITGGQFSGQSQARAYGSTSFGTVITDPLDFGALPNYGGPFAIAHITSVWFKTSQPGLSLISTDVPKDNYIYTFNRNDGFGFPGYSMTTIQRTANGTVASDDTVSCSMFDNDSNGTVPYGVQSLKTVNDGQWHLVTGLYYSVGTSLADKQGCGRQYITIDGDLGFVGGTDDGGNPGSHPFGASFSQCLLGSPQDATRAATTPVYHFMGSDDDGFSSQFYGMISDHRIYDLRQLASGASSGDVVAYFLALSQHMYAPETRWELYRAPVRQAFPLPPAAPGPSPKRVYVSQAINRAGSF